MRSLFCCMSKNNEGVSAIEFAFISPIMLAVMIGIFQFGIAMNQYFESHQRGSPGGADACIEPRYHDAVHRHDVGDQFGRANLTPAQTTITVRINGTDCTTDATCSAALIAGQPAFVRATYPCNLTVMGVNYPRPAAP